MTSLSLGFSFFDDHVPQNVRGLRCPSHLQHLPYSCQSGRDVYLLTFDSGRGQSYRVLRRFVSAKPTICVALTTIGILIFPDAGAGV
jgi:hypothetical protein